MEKQNVKGNVWLFPGIVAGIYLLAAVSGGFMPLFFLELILPVFIAVSAVKSGIWPTVALGTVCALCCALCGLSALLPVSAGWSVLALAAGLFPLKQKPEMRPYLWGGAVVIAWGAWILMLQSAFSGQMIVGLAQAMADEINANSQRDMLLMGAYNLGLARLSDPGATMTETVYGQMILNLTDGARTELLNSFRTSMEELFPSILCESFILHLTINVFLCTLLPDHYRRKQGEKGIFPPLDEWHMPRGTGLKIGLFAIGYVIPSLTGSGMWLNVGTIFAGVFTIVYGLQGCCMLLWIEKRMGMRSAMRYIWAVVIGLFVPFLSVIMGIMDQTRDVRHLRIKEEM